MSYGCASAADTLYVDTDISVTESEHTNLFETCRTFADTLCDVLY